MRKKKELDERKIVYDISSWSETERRNEMLLKAALRLWRYNDIMYYEGRYSS